MKKLFYVVSWQYWKTNQHCWGYITHIFTKEQERNEMFNSLCPCVHEYPNTFEQEYTNEQIAEFLTKDEYCVHL